MVRLALIEQVGYREWTESIGSDREWIIQSLQARLYGELQLVVSRLGGYLFPLRHDYLLALATGLGEREHKEILDTARSVSGMPIRMASVAHDNPRDALEKAFRLLSNTRPGEYTFVEGHDGLTVVGHVDIDNITGKTSEEGISESLLLIAKTVYEVTRESMGGNGLAQYLGGDNIVVILPDEGYEDIVERIASNPLLKVGVGVSLKPRRAMELATKALDEIRLNRSEGRIRYLVG